MSLIVKISTKQWTYNWTSLCKLIFERGTFQPNMTIFSANDSSILNPYSYQTLRTYGKGEELKKKIFVRNFENIFKPIGYTWPPRYKLGFNCSNIICLNFHLLNRQFKVPDRKRLWVRVSIWMGLCIWMRHEINTEKESFCLQLSRNQQSSWNLIDLILVN